MTNTHEPIKSPAADATAAAFLPPPASNPENPQQNPTVLSPPCDSSQAAPSSVHQNVSAVPPASATAPASAA